jgi:cellobiose-specific phosphotransferase system component IIC
MMQFQKDKRGKIKYGSDHTEKKTLKDKFFVTGQQNLPTTVLYILSQMASPDLLPITMIGTLVSLITIVDNVYQSVKECQPCSSYVKLGDTMTNGIISIFLVAAMAYEMAKGIKKSPIAAILISLVCFFILTPMTNFTVKDSTVAAFTTTYLGSKGMFVGMVTALLATKLFAVFMDKGIKIKMPAEVPSAISESIESVFRISLPLPSSLSYHQWVSSLLLPSAVPMASSMPSCRSLWKVPPILSGQC